MLFRSGKEIFYFVDGRKLMAAEVRNQPKLEVGTPRLLLERRYSTGLGISGFPKWDFDVSADGKHFIVLEKPSGEPLLSIHVVHNWFEEFRRK